MLLVGTRFYPLSTRFYPDRLDGLLIAIAWMVEGRTYPRLVGWNNPHNCLSVVKEEGRKNTSSAS